MGRWSEMRLQPAHVHRFERAGPRGLSRGQLLRRGAAVAGGVAGAGLLGPAAAFAKPGNGDPSPIPGGFAFGPNGPFPVPSDPVIHVLPPEVGFEMSSITDFKGYVAAADVQGSAQGSDASQYSFDVDVRFMQGTYVDVDGRVQHGAFGLI